MSRNSLQDLGDGPALLQLFHWTVIGWGWVWLRVCLLGSKISISFSWRDSHSLDVDVNQEVQLSFHGKNLRDSKKPTQLMSGCIIKKLTLLFKITSLLLFITCFSTFPKRPIMLGSSGSSSLATLGRSLSAIGVPLPTI